MASSKFGVETEILMVTPAMAESWLAKMGPNRPLRRLDVDRLAADIDKGAWELNGETIKFLKNGTLVDGQHRLAAVIASRKAVPMEVVRGITETAVQTIDTGRARSFSDVLFIEGGVNVRAVAATAKWIWRYDTDQMIGKYRQPSNSELRATLNDYPGIHDSVREVQRSKEIQPHSAIAFVLTIAKLKKPKKAATWLEKLHDGADLRRSDPILHLRRRLLSRKAVINPLRPVEAAGLIAVAWNAYSNNEEMTSLAWNEKDGFPTIR